MNKLFYIVWSAIYIEYMLVLLLAFMIIFSRINLALKRKNRARIIKKVKFVLLNTLNTNESLHASAFKVDWLKIRPLLTALEELDQEHNTPAWQSIRADFIKQILTPAARKEAYSHDVFHRIYATEVFNMYCEENDEEMLSTLLQDNSPLVRNGAATAAIRLGSYKLIAYLIDRIAESRWFYRSTLAYYFQFASKDIRQMVLKKLSSTEDAYTRAACYNILGFFPPDKTLNWSKDSTSNNIELKIAVHKYLATTAPKAAINILIKAIFDDNAQVRLTAIHRLYLLNAIEAIESLTQCLNDPDWNVRISAAKALIHISPNGKQIVTDKAPDLDQGLIHTTYLEHMLW